MGGTPGLIALIFLIWNNADMNRSVAPLVTRRAVVLGGLAAAGLSALQLGGPADPADAAPDKGSLTLRPVESVARPFFGTDLLTEQLVDAPLVLQLSGLSADDMKLVVDITFDERAWIASERLVAIGGGAIVVLQRLGTGRSPARYTGPLHGEARAPMTFDIPLRLRSLYPNEGVAPVSATAVTASTGFGRTTTYGSRPGTAMNAITTWGAELHVAWATTEVRDQGAKAQYRVPRRVQCLSTGPSAIPAGSHLILTTDSRLATLPIPESVRIGDQPFDLKSLSASRSAEGHATRTALTLPAPVPAGERFDIALVAPRTTRTPPNVTGISFARVALEASADSRSRRRSTGRDTIVDLSSSGTPSKPGIAVGTI